MLAECGVTDVLLVAALADSVTADNDEEDLEVFRGDDLGGAHEDVESAHRLEPPG